LEFEKGVGIVNHEIDRATLWAGCPVLQEHLDLTEIHAREGWWLARGKGEPKAELARVEVHGGRHVADVQARVVLLAFDLRRRGHEASPSLAGFSGALHQLGTQ